MQVEHEGPPANRRGDDSDKHAWSAPPETPELSRDLVHVWRAGLDWNVPHGELLDHALDDEERSRAVHFAFEQDRKRFIVAHAALRIILGRYLDIPPGEISFTANQWGKCFLASGAHARDLRFNMSHSDDLALFAVACGREVGVDLERVRPELATREIAERFFSREEAAEIRSLPEDERTEGFFNCWTRKEAYIKATGKGLSMPLDDFQVSLAPNGAAEIIRTRPDPREASRWSLVILHPGRGYAAAVAVEGHGWQLSRRQLPPEWLKAIA